MNCEDALQGDRLSFPLDASASPVSAGQASGTADQLAPETKSPCYFSARPKLKDVQAAWGEDQGVNLVDRTVGRYEVDVRPDAERVGVGQVTRQLMQAFPLVLVP